MCVEFRVLYQLIELIGGRVEEMKMETMKLSFSEIDDGSSWVPK